MRTTCLTRFQILEKHLNRCTKKNKQKLQGFIIHNEKMQKNLE